jgi:SAM-dependent methyltransferase
MADRADRHAEILPAAHAPAASSRRSCKAMFFPESRFGGFTDCDAHVMFFTRVSALLTPESVVLDIGCGRGRGTEDPVLVRRRLRTLKGRCRRVIGIDTDPAAARNPGVDEFRSLSPSGGPWPVDDASIDLAVCVSVLEHVADPEHLFAECRRVLKFGGYLCLRTSNALSYSGLAARMIPNRYHPAIIRRIYETPRQEEDVFPTLHRCNTVFRVRQALRRNGLEGCVYGYQSQPSSLAFSRVFYALGIVHQHLAPGFLKPTIFAFARRTR